ncbi:MAG: alanine--tRNA ligase [Dehalococcoidia bacterium]|nr:alanine--tRNA ligase [Dehalococcoidia bacterium]
MPSPPRTSDEIRAAFVDFFAERDHRQLPPWPLVPVGDPTTLFTTAGMQQFKPYFTGQDDPPVRRATTVQRAFRVTDIEEVGDFSHCTAFEMLGNFSFGDYFKAEAIAWAWDLSTRVYQLPPERIHVSIHDDDDEAYAAWRETGVPHERIHRYDESENYWYSGPVGPCGPNTEIFYDYFPERGVEGANPAADGERFLEYWNLVLMQNFRHEDGSLTDLPKKNIDTGSGLERVAAIQQGKSSIFETDIFLPILEEAAAIVGADYLGGRASSSQGRAIRAMSEHARAATLLVGDGVVPSNEGRGYVLRRILRRAVYMARREGVDEPFLHRLVEASIGKLGPAYPHLEEARDFILRAIGGEEDRFLRTLSAASQRLEFLLYRLEHAGEQVVPGDEAFALYDTFGLPIELTREIAAVRDFTVDVEGFEAALERQRRSAREAAMLLGGGDRPDLAAIDGDHSAFTGWENVTGEATPVAILSDGGAAEVIPAGTKAEVVLDSTPFYPEGGGQLGDRGLLVSAGGVFQVEDTQAASGAIVHSGSVIEGELRRDDAIRAEVDLAWRAGVTRNHTATHLLHAGLRSILGQHVRQQGSLVADERLRFDFTHLESAPRESLDEVESLVNGLIRENRPVEWRMTTYQQAIDDGALAFFGDKYGAEVRVVEIGGEGTPFSAELCGGTHVGQTGELGLVHILRESAVAAGTRRIEALSGASAERFLLDQHARLQRLAERLSTPPADLEARIEGIQEELAGLRSQVADLQLAQAADQSAELAEAAERIGDAHLVVARVQAASREALKELADDLRRRLTPSLLVLAAVIDDRPAFVVAATPDLVEAGVHAGNIVRDVAKAAGGGGGGRPDLAEAGARDPGGIDAALAEGHRRASAALADR